MQLAQAIEAWVEVHGRNLSTSTRRDIADIAAGIEWSGYGESATGDITVRDATTIAAEAATYCALNQGAIAEFLQVVLAWARTRPAADRPAAAPTAAAEHDDEAIDAEAPDGAIDDDNERHATDADLDDEADDDGGDDARDVDDEAEDDLDDDGDDEAEDDLDDEADEDDEDEDYVDDDEDDEDLDYDDDDDEDEDDEDEDLDDDDEDEDEDEDEDDEDDEEDDDHPVVVISSGGPGEFEPTLPDDQRAASSFLQAIESAPRPDFSAAPVVDPAPHPTPGGIFSAAAEQRGPEPKAGIDWITVAYFTIAAICFALVIYFYLSS